MLWLRRGCASTGLSHAQSHPSEIANSPEEIPTTVSAVGYEARREVVLAQLYAVHWCQADSGSCEIAPRRFELLSTGSKPVILGH